MGISVTSGPEITPAIAAGLLDELTKIAGRASAAILANPAATVAHHAKEDGSPVTAADEASEAVIHEGCQRILGDVPVVSEEQAARPAALALRRSFILVDPLDGTREFLQGRDEFTVNLAIVNGGTPIAGIIAAPARRWLWRGIVGVCAERLRLHADGTADESSPIRTRTWPGPDAIAAVSRSHFDRKTDSLLQRLGVVKRLSAGSSLKFCCLAEGTADIYPRLSPTCEWDIAAGHAILTAAGGVMTSAQRTPIVYGNSEKHFRVPDFIAWGDPAQTRAGL